MVIELLLETEYDAHGGKVGMGFVARCNDSTLFRVDNFPMLMSLTHPSNLIRSVKDVSLAEKLREAARENGLTIGEVYHPPEAFHEGETVL